MQKYTFLEHTADAKVLLEATTPQELFQVALTALFALQKPHRLQGEEIAFQVSIHAPDQTVLLIDFLSHILTLSHIHQVVFDRIVIIHCDEHTLSAHVFAKKAQKIERDVKAVTFHEAEIVRTSSGSYQTIIIFDI